MQLIKSMFIAASGMRVQGTRLRVVSENIANANSLPTVPGEDPYRRKVILFREELNRSIDANVVEVHRIDNDRRPFNLRHDPSHPAANSEGYVLTPNVNSLIEMTDMREAQRSYEANLGVIESSRGMITRTLDILR